MGVELQTLNHELSAFCIPISIFCLITELYLIRFENYKVWVEKYWNLPIPSWHHYAFIMAKTSWVKSLDNGANKYGFQLLNQLLVLNFRGRWKTPIWPFGRRGWRLRYAKKWHLNGFSTLFECSTTETKMEWPIVHLFSMEPNSRLQKTLNGIESSCPYTIPAPLEFLANLARKQPKVRYCILRSFWLLGLVICNLSSTLLSEILLELTAVNGNGILNDFAEPLTSWTLFCAYLSSLLAGWNRGNSKPTQKWWQICSKKCSTGQRFIFLKWLLTNSIL